MECCSALKWPQWIARWQRAILVNVLVVMNKVTLCWVWLVLGWVTVCRQVNHVGK